MPQLLFIISILTTVSWYGKVGTFQPSCKTETDTLTKRVVYVTADIEPLNNGGNDILIGAFKKKIHTTDSFPGTKDYDLSVVVAFIVDKDGSITGERIVRDKTQKLGAQMLEVIRSFKWTPAICNGKNVSMILKRKMIIDIVED